MTVDDIGHVALRGGDDVVALRQLMVRTGRLLGLEGVEVTRLATSASELARASLQPSGADAHVRVRRQEGVRRACLEVLVRYRDGPPQELQESSPTRSVILRLVDQLEVGADAVLVTRTLPVSVSDDDVARLREGLLLEPPGDLRAALQTQNTELVAALIAVREREAELVQLNQELEETNRGVVALYAQLEQGAAEVRQAQRLVFEELEAALRPPAPTVPGLRLDVRYLPAQANSPTGGDLYDWFVLPDGRLHITVVDVQGHGVQSTRDALLVTHTVRTLVLEEHRLGQVLARTDVLLQSLDSSVVATALLAQFDPRTGELQLAGAGHPPALRLPPVGEATFAEAPGRPIGYPTAGSEAATTLALEPGETVLLYTDGVVELRKDILEGLETLRGAAAAARGPALAPDLDAIIAGCSQGQPFLDDTLLLSMHWELAPRTGPGD